MKCLAVGTLLLATAASAAAPIDGSWTGDLATGDDSREIHLDFFDSPFGPLVRLTFADLGRRYTTTVTTGEPTRFAVSTVRYGYLEIEASTDGERMTGSVRGDVFGTLALHRIEPSCAACPDAAGWYERDDERMLLTHRPRAGMLMVIYGENSLAMGDRFADGDRLARWDGETITETMELRRDTAGDVTSIVRRGTDSETAWSRLPDPYRQTPVEFRSGRLRLAGTLFEPVGVPVQAAVATIQGSLGGRFATRENFWQLSLADRLARRGVAVLVPDKRGCGSSDGEWTLASIDDLADDALASVQVLREHFGEAVPTGLLGLSEGARVASAAAARGGAADFAIAISGSTRNSLDNSMFEIGALGASAGLSESAIADALRLQSAGNDYAISRSADDWERYLALRAELVGRPELRELVEPFPVQTGHPRVVQLAHRASFDPLAHWRRVTVPVFAAWGTEDVRVPGHESHDTLRALLDSLARPVPHELHLYQGSGHGLDDPDTGRLRDDFVDDLVRWLAATGAGPTSRDRP